MCVSLARVRCYLDSLLLGLRQHAHLWKRRALVVVLAAAAVLVAASKAAEGAKVAAEGTGGAAASASAVVIEGSERCTRWCPLWWSLP